MSQATSNGAAGSRGLRGAHYKWVALSNTTLGMLAATVNASIVIIALPDHPGRRRRDGTAASANGRRSRMGAKASATPQEQDR